jgi:hypothetical protein
MQEEKEPAIIVGAEQWPEQQKTDMSTIAIEEVESNTSFPKMFPDGVLLSAMVDFLPKQVGDRFFTEEDAYNWLGNPLSRVSLRAVLQNLREIGFLKCHKGNYKINWEVQEKSEEKTLPNIVPKT